MRAANIARMQAELINGGGSQYSPANCMHQGGGETCMISNIADGFRFRFLGGGGGWAARREPAGSNTTDQCAKAKRHDATKTEQPNQRWRGSSRNRF